MTGRSDTVFYRLWQTLSKQVAVDGCVVVVQRIHGFWERHCKSSKCLARKLSLRIIMQSLGRRLGW